MQEIIYTSAQSGLKPGSSGFCTVVCTAGMDQRTSQRLEGLSGYRHPFAVNDPRNPINYQHVTMRIGAATTHVLSKVCDAGPDHTGRTNKLAHHVAITERLSPSGPARLLAAEGVFVDKWDGKTSQQAPRVLPAIGLENTTLTAWESLTGDGGWAGHIAEQLIRTKQPVYVLFAPGTGTLPLLTEVLDVVPPNRRWAVTFSTYYTNAIAGAECQLRFVLDGTQDATKLRNDARANIVDLTTDLPPATGGELVSLARKGLVTYGTPNPASKQQPVQSAKTSGVADESFDVWDETEFDINDPVSTSGSGVSSELNAAPPRSQAPNLFGAYRSQKDRKLAAAGKKSSSGWIIGLVFGILLLIGGLGTGIWFVLLSGWSDIGGEQSVADSQSSKAEAEAIQEEAAAGAPLKNTPLTDADGTGGPPDADPDPEPPLESSDDLDDRKGDEPEPPPKTIVTDIFGDELQNGAKISDPAVRVIPWDTGIPGVTIPVAHWDSMDVMLHHHQVGYDVDVADDSRKWTVTSGVGGFKFAVAEIVRLEDNKMQLSRVRPDAEMRRAVCQLVAGERCGFVLFQPPERFDAPSLRGTLFTDDNQNSTKFESAPIGPAYPRHAVQTAKLFDSTEKVLTPVKIEPGDPAKVVFHLEAGPETSRHRHVLELVRNKQRSKINYRLELLDRTDIAPPVMLPLPTSDPIQDRKKLLQWANFMQKHIGNILSPQKVRTKWNKVRCRELNSWDPKSHALNLQKTVVEAGRGLARFRDHNFELTADDQRILDDAEANLDELRKLMRHVKKLPADASKSREDLAEFRIDFNAHLPIKQTIQIPGSKKHFQLRIPIVQYQAKKVKDRLGWEDISVPVDGPVISPESLRHGVKGVPPPPLLSQ